MQAVIIRSSAIAVMFGLAACGGAGGDGGGGGGGGTGGGPGTNGLDYATATQTLSDAEGVQITGQKASFQVGSNAQINSGTITLDPGFLAALSDGARDGTLEIFELTVDIENGVGTLPGPGGEEVRITYNPNRSETYAGILDITVGGDDAGDINGAGTYVFGFETNPSQVDARSGSLIYSGDFVALGSLDGNVDTSTEYEGAMTVTVNFNGAGTAGVAINGRLNDADDATLSGSLGLSGNGFSGGLTCSAGCNNGGGSSVDATFYGPNAIELGGVVAVDITVGGHTYDGVGTFILTPP